MSKVEDLSRQYVLPFLDKQYEKYGEHRQMELSRFNGYDMMSAYEEGYHQAEKDVALTWEDMMLIHKCIKDAMNYHLYKMMEGEEGQKTVYQEILKRFQDLKK